MPETDHSGTARRWTALLRRLAAGVYDLLLVMALLMMVTALALIARAGRPPDPHSISFRTLLLVSWWAYFAWSWTHGGQTVGMRAWRLELKTPAGSPASLRQATLRFAAAWLSALALGLGFIWCLVDRDGRTWHDRLSGTDIVRAKSAQSDDGERGHEQQQGAGSPGRHDGIE
jgi:uncharacterized RDD family membrane protein YckC